MTSVETTTTAPVAASEPTEIAKAGADAAGTITPPDRPKKDTTAPTATTDADKPAVRLSLPRRALSGCSRSAPIVANPRALTLRAADRDHRHGHLHRHHLA